MKYWLVLLLSVFHANLLMACPQLAGNYTCTDHEVVNNKMIINQKTLDGIEYYGGNYFEIGADDELLPGSEKQQNWRPLVRSSTKTNYIEALSCFENQIQHYIMDEEMNGGVRKVLRRESNKRVRGEFYYGVIVNEEFTTLKQSYFSCQRITDETPTAAEILEQMDFVTIPSGKFKMGCDTENYCQPDEFPSREVTIDKFKLMSKEVTWDLYQKCIDDGKCRNNYKDGGDNGWGKGMRPVIEINKDDINDFILFLGELTHQNFRLPTEAEWEYAARANTKTKYHWGDEIDCTKAHYSSLDDGGECGNKNGTKPVGTYEPNAFGLYDMLGNVAEFVSDCRTDNYKRHLNNGRSFQSGDCSYYMHRGGSFAQLSRSQLRSGYRNWVAEEKARRSFLGFRLALDIDE